jgi:hypothetical protein
MKKLCVNQNVNGKIGLEPFVTVCLGATTCRDPTISAENEKMYFGSINEYLMFDVKKFVRFDSYNVDRVFVSLLVRTSKNVFLGSLQ